MNHTWRENSATHSIQIVQCYAKLKTNQNNMTHCILHKDSSMTNKMSKKP